MAGFLKNLFDKKAKVEKVDIARRFELLARVGQGSMSKVWRARDNMTGKMLAVKVLDKLKTERFEARFVGLKKPQEGDIAASLQHRNIVHTIEHGTTTTDEPYLVMDFVEGTSLSFLVDTQNDQMRDNCLNYIIQLGEGIDYLHRQNWIHRDICPRNVMVDQDNVVKLIDFGLVVPNTPDFQKPGNRTGTANYMAPELIKRQRTDQRIDIFSFSVTAYEMFTKRLPWDVAEQATLETVLQHINTPPKPISLFAPHIDPRVAEVLMKGLESNPSDRWQTMAELLVPLRKIHDELEAKQQLERKLKAAAAKAKGAKSPEAIAAAKAKAKKAQEDDDFFDQIMSDDPASKTERPKTAPKIASEPKPVVEAPVPKKSPTPASKPAATKPAAAKSAPTKPLKPAVPSKPKPPVSNDDDEFDGIEIEVEGHKLDHVTKPDESDDEFDGIEIEVEGELPVEPPVASKRPTSERKFPSLLAAETRSTTPSAAADDDDEPVLRLPDD